jgi:hypothetical protein
MRMANYLRSGRLRKGVGERRERARLRIFAFLGKLLARD